MKATTSPLLTRDEMESRRLQAAQELQSGLSQAQVARKFGVSRTTASRWYRVVQGEKGVDALRKRQASGRPRRLTPDQEATLVDLYHNGPGEAGFEGKRWTSKTFGDAIYAAFNVRYDPDHVGRMMHRLGVRTKRNRKQPRVNWLVVAGLHAMGQLAQVPAEISA